MPRVLPLPPTGPRLPLIVQRCLGTTVRFPQTVVSVLRTGIDTERGRHGGCWNNFVARPCRSHSNRQRSEVAKARITPQFCFFVISTRMGIDLSPCDKKRDARARDWSCVKLRQLVGQHLLCAILVTVVARVSEQNARHLTNFRFRRVWFAHS